GFLPWPPCSVGRDGDTLRRDPCNKSLYCSLGACYPAPVNKPIPEDQISGFCYPLGACRPARP
ncbi:MAG: hypothetical protein RMM98_17580, partial [Acidobacteriota bacterium]|nr:hypothetical protein [Acidobacteriota bacterium]